MPHVARQDPLGSDRRSSGRQGILRWGYVRDLGAIVEVSVDDEGTFIPTMSATRTATGVYVVVVPGVDADGGRHVVLVSAQQGRTTVFRAWASIPAIPGGVAQLIESGDQVSQSRLIL